MFYFNLVKIKSMFLLKFIAILDQLDLFKFFLCFRCANMFLVNMHDPQQLVSERSSRYMFFIFSKLNSAMHVVCVGFLFQQLR
jgi:hypothetical protein